MRIRHLISTLAVVAIATLVAAGPTVAAGPGPSGSAEDGGNSVTCNSYPNAPDRVDLEPRSDGLGVHGNTGTVYAGAQGVEACGDNGSAWRGRVFVDGNGATYDGATWAGDPNGADNGCVSVGAGGLNTAC